MECHSRIIYHISTILKEIITKFFTADFYNLTKIYLKKLGLAK